MKLVQATKIDVAFVHDIEGAGLETHMVEKMDIVHLTACNADKRRNIGSQVQLGMHLDSVFVSAMLRPGKQRQAQIDDGGIQGVNRSFEIHGQGLMGVKGAGLTDQKQGDVAIDFLVAQFVGLGQGVARHSCLHSGMIEFGPDGPQTGFDIAQTLSPGELSKGHAIKLIETGKRADAMVALISIDAGLESPPRKEIHDLRENNSSLVHVWLL